MSERDRDSKGREKAGSASWGLGDERLKGLWLVVMEKVKFWEILAFNFQRGRNWERENFCLKNFERGVKG